MNDYNALDQFQITNVEPVYEYEKIAGGYFNVYFGKDDEPFRLSFAPFLNYIVQKDSKLLSYLKKKANTESISTTVYDLYDIGAPVDEWVRDYMDLAKTQVDPKLFHAMLQFYYFMKNFGYSEGDISGSFD